MADLPIAAEIRRAGSWSGAAGRVVLDYEARFLRRKRLETEGGEAFLADLPETVSLSTGDAFALADGRVIEVVAADEPLYEVTGTALARLAWHIGNRHTPCAIGADRLTIRRDHVLKGMLEGLGATVREVTGPFVPEGGAYGVGRTMGHAHEAPGHDHAHGAGRKVHHHGGHVPHEPDPPEPDV